MPALYTRPAARPARPLNATAQTTRAAMSDEDRDAYHEGLYALVSLGVLALVIAVAFLALRLVGP